MPELSQLGLVAVVAAALVVGIAKTSVSGFGAVASALFALSMPAKESTAAVLLLLILGDVVAVSYYRKHAEWALLRTLLPSVLPGIVLGAVFMRFVDDDLMRRSIGAMVLVMVAIQLVMRWRSRHRDAPDGPAGPARWAPALAAGTAAGFTTMTANAAGPVMTIYLLVIRIDKQRFIATNAWFFFLVNLSKVPFSAALGLFPATTLVLTATLVPVVLLGAWLGIRVAKRLNQNQFEWIALLASLGAGAALLI